MHYASGDSRATDTGCDYVASVRGTCCDSHRAEVREREVRSGRSGNSAAMSDAELLRQARELGLTGNPSAPSVRSDALAASLATARTRSERRDAVRRFMEAQKSPEDARFTQWLRGQGHGRAYEDRAMGEASLTTGGALVPERFSDSVIRQMKEFDGILRHAELWRSDYGEAYERPVTAQFSTAATATENAAFTEGPYPTIGHQPWAVCPTYAASFVASNQLVQDAFTYTTPAGPGFTAFEGADSTYGVLSPPQAPDVNLSNAGLDDFVSSALGESLGRAIAPVAQTALYAAISGVGANSGQNGGYVALGAATPVTFASGATTELAAGTISIDTAALMLEALDAAYLETAAWFMSSVQWGGVLRQVDSQGKAQVNVSSGKRSLYGLPVVITSQATAATASTVAGPVLGDLGAALTLRVVNGSFGMLRSAEARAEYAEMYYRSWVRADVQARDARAVVGVHYAAS